MIKSTQYIRKFAQAVADNAGLAAWCIEHFKRPHLVRKQELPGHPLSSGDAPWVCFLTWTGAELGEVSDGASCAVNVTCGISAPGASDVEIMQSAVRVERERTADVAGIEEVGDAALAEEFLSRVLDIVASDECGALVETAGVESDGWSQFPLQIASAVLTVADPPVGLNRLDE